MTQSIGQKLKQAREEQRITLEHASESTRIRMLYLKALETDDVTVLPSPVQARGFLRNYADYLGLDFDRLLDELRAEQTSSDEIIGPTDVSPQSVTPTPGSLSPPDSAQVLRSHIERVSIAGSDSPLEQTPEKPKRRGRKKAEPTPEPLDGSQI